MEELFDEFDHSYEEEGGCDQKEQSLGECYICMVPFKKTGRNRMIALCTCPFPHADNCCWGCISLLVEMNGIDNLKCPICRFPFKVEYVLDEEANIKIHQGQLKHINDEINKIQSHPDY